MLTASRLLNAALMSKAAAGGDSATVIPASLISTIDQCCLSRYVVSLDNIIQANPDFPIAQLIPQLAPVGRERLSMQVRRHLSAALDAKL